MQGETIIEQDLSTGYFLLTNAEAGEITVIDKLIISTERKDAVAVAQMDDDDTPTPLGHPLRRVYSEAYSGLHVLENIRAKDAGKKLAITSADGQGNVFVYAKWHTEASS